MTMAEKKKHHIIPRTYLQHFTSTEGKLHVYRKDAPNTALLLRPENTAFRRFYYSQPLPGGGRDNNTLEDLFSDLCENNWNSVVQKLKEQKELNAAEHEVLYNMLSFSKVRVPAARDAMEYLLSEAVRMTAKQLDDMGQFSEVPNALKELKGRIFDRGVIDISIDPHMSIHSMTDMLNGFSEVLDHVSFEVLVNKTGSPFITSDNPVVYFDPNIPSNVLKPYTLNKKKMCVELFFPITPELVLHGHSDFKLQWSQTELPYKYIGNIEKIFGINKYISRFAYEQVIASSSEHCAIVKKHAHLSPVLSIEELKVKNGRTVLSEFQFGKRRKLPKWKN